ncbi:MAG: acyltransferase family protein [Propionibacteriaceae bacterium]
MTKPGLRTDIEGLRALAVGLVVVYHLWPGAVPGGFVGVDVFFVISGFLITSHLLTTPPRHWRDLTAFWSRRIRRLLPASLTVLTASLLASRLLAPETQWAHTARQIRAAALFVVNWRLAGDAVDYSAADAAASPVQHFWSLSVEEQFYLVWPLLIGLAILLAVRVGVPELRAVRLVLVALVVGSLTYSVFLTIHDPAQAYFVTPTRIWELGIGALLAATLLNVRWRLSSRRPGPQRLRIAVTWMGLLAIVVAAVAYSSTTPFPGSRALLPVLGAAAVIATGDPRGAGAPGAVLALRPVQWVGGVSYAVYLWHWPLMIALPYVKGDSLGELDRVTIVAVTMVLAGATKRFVEDPFRTRRVQRWWRPFVAAGLAIVLLVGLSTVQLVEVGKRQADQDARVATALAVGGTCFGAAALDDGARCPETPVDALVPAVGQAPLDQYDTAHQLRGNNTCWASEPRYDVRTCEFGDPRSDVHVAVVGNSHAAQWLGALEDIADRRGWRLTVMVAHSCAMIDARQSFATGEQTRGCQRWVTSVRDRVAAGDFDLVVLSNKVSARPPGRSRAESLPELTAGYQQVLGSWLRSGTPVVAIRDTAEPARTIGRVPECLERHPDEPRACGGTRTDWLLPDPVVAAVAATDDRRVRLVDLSDHLCEPDYCAPAVGGVVVYSDFSHLTTTYARTLAPYLDGPLTQALHDR